MAKAKKSIFWWLFFSAAIVLLIVVMQPLELYLFKDYIPVLFPNGMIAHKQLNLLLLIQVVMLFFVIPIYICTFLFSWWYRAGNEKSKYDPHLVDSVLAEVFWWGIPLVLTIIVCVITVYKTYELDPYRPIASDKKPVKIEAVALQWKWLFIYPEEKIATVNYIRVPKETPIEFDITADAPMNALWIPDLGSMIYAMPGMRTKLHLIADTEGNFRGSSTMVSGYGFAGMVFKTEATTEEEYRDWVGTVQGSGGSMTWEEYQQVAKPSENNPISLYRLGDENLFNAILMKYMEPHVR
ncbi:MAG: COX aromatic rich motif-containing protein [Chlamydiia bacterium]|nr:COX aromatic rich motif-containing protein [Chlamydiia bacterium]